MLEWRPEALALPAALGCVVAVAAQHPALSVLKNGPPGQDRCFSWIPTYLFTHLLILSSCTVCVSMCGARRTQSVLPHPGEPTSSAGPQFATSAAIPWTPAALASAVPQGFELGSSAPVTSTAYRPYSSWATELCRSLSPHPLSTPLPGCVCLGWGVLSAHAAPATLSPPAALSWETGGTPQLASCPLQPPSGQSPRAP